MWHLDIHTQKELEEYLGSKKDPDFLANWIAEDNVRIGIEKSEDMEKELERTRLGLEDEREYDDENLTAHVEKLLKKLRVLGGDEHERIFLERELQKEFLNREIEICEKELLRRRKERIEEGKADESQAETRVQAVEFTVQVSEFSKALRYLRPARARGKKARADFVDINARTEEIEIVAPGVSFSLPAKVIRPGYARVPYLTFEWFNKAVKTMRQPSVEVAISQGQVKTANLSFKHPDISTRLIGSRIADLPIDAPLADVLALLVKFRPEELSDSGLSARVLDAQETASGLIDRALKALSPLEIKREKLNEFIWEQIKERSQRDR
jgi:hypothetical protein